MWLSLFIVLIVIAVLILLFSITYKDGYQRAYKELTDSGMSKNKAKIISRIIAFIYVF